MVRSASCSEMKRSRLPGSEQWVRSPCAARSIRALVNRRLASTPRGLRGLGDDFRPAAGSVRSVRVAAATIGVGRSFPSVGTSGGELRATCAVVLVALLKPIERRCPRADVLVVSWCHPDTRTGRRALVPAAGPRLAAADAYQVGTVNRSRGRAHVPTAGSAAYRRAEFTHPVWFPSVNERPIVSQSEMLGHSSAFRAAYLNQAEIEFSAAEREKLGHLTYLRRGRFVNFISLQGGAGYELRLESRDDEVIETHRPLLQAMLPLSDEKFNYGHQGMYLKGSRVQLMGARMTDGACLGIEDSEVLLAHAELLDQNNVFGLRGSDFDVTIFQSRIGAGLGLRRIEFARLRGDGSPCAWITREAKREVDSILVRARTEMLLDERRHAPFSWLAKNAALVLGDFLKSAGDDSRQ
jgi:hypothetical protein